MPEKMPEESTISQPDWFLVTRQSSRLPDRGPRYQETPPDPHAPNAPVPAEPWNTVTAFFFVLIVLFWVWRLRGRYSRYVFLTACLPILMTGAVGGTLYHATRTVPAYFWLDVIPISLLGAAGAVYLAVKLGRSMGTLRTMFFAIGLIAVYIGVNFVIRLVPTANPNMAVNLSYASLAAILLAPLAVMLVRTKFRHAGWVVGSIASFGIAWFCRLIDNTPYSTLPMGTHWLWHTFGALTTLAITEYFYLIEGESALPSSSSNVTE